MKAVISVRPADPADGGLQRRAVLAGMAGLLGLSAGVMARPAHARFVDPLDAPATPSSQAPCAPYIAVASRDSIVLAAGLRGLVVRSADEGRSWQQAQVPVSTDLVALSFPTPTQAWAVGHSGVVLHSADAGLTWQRLLDGRTTGALAVRHYETASADLPPARRAAALEQARQLAAEAETQPLLDAWFRDADNGFVAGAFNRLFHTGDGGRNWTPWLEKTDNPDSLHFFAVKGLGEEVFLAGERGMVWRWEAASGRFVAAPCPYNGSLFGLLVTPRVLFAFGMRGSLFRSEDRGRRWERVPLKTQSALVASSTGPRGELMVLSQSGEVFVSRDEGQQFVRVVREGVQAASGLAVLPRGQCVFAGPRGVRRAQAL